MSPRKRRLEPVSSFGPELLDLMKAAARHPITLEMESWKAKRMQLRFYRLWKALEAEGHPDWKIGCRVTTSRIDSKRLEKRDSLGRIQSVMDPSGTSKLTFLPADHEFRSAIEGAGIKRKTLDETLDENTAPTAINPQEFASDDEMEDFLEEQYGEDQ